jgi:ferredoxin
MRVYVDPELCSGCGLCVDTCPEVFELEEEIAVVKMDEVPVELQETCREAVDNCPTEAISIEQ